MRHEHVITYIGYPSIADLDFVARKANKLGRFGKELIRAYEESDEEGKHVYFDVASIVKAKNESK